jgi:UDP-glucuronate decarboxylase
MDSSDEITGPINLGNPNEFTIKQLAELVLRLTKSKSMITFHPLPSDDPKQRKPDVSRAVSTLGFHPSVEIEQGLISTISYFQKVIDEPAMD